MDAMCGIDWAKEMSNALAFRSGTLAEGDEASRRVGATLLTLAGALDERWSHLLTHEERAAVRPVAAEIAGALVAFLAGP